MRPFADPAARRGDLTIFHYALPSPMTEAFASLPRGRVLQYHNVTPARVLRAVRSGAVPARRARPRRSWRRSLGRVDLALGDSEYNRQELEALGFAPTGVLPDRRRHRRASPAGAAARRSSSILDDGLVNFLFVGRIAPNKKIEDHIRLAEHYKRYVDAYYRFIFVGRYDVRAALLFDDPRADGRVPAAATIASSSPARCPDEELAVYYRHAAVYISLSEHEGFCVPLVEAMAADVPVLAYAAAAVPDTLGGAGVQFAPKDLEYRRGAARRAGLRRRPARAGHRRPAAPARRLRRRAHHARARRRLRPATLVKLAFIIQRYGTEVLGGSEHLLPAASPSGSPPQHDVEVLTTCARDYVTWKNEYPEGPDRVRGVTVRRFANARTRDIEAFNRYSDWIFNNPHTPRRRDGVAEAAGAVVPGAASSTCARSTSSTTSLIFFTYLYAPTVLGLEVAPAQQHPRADGARRAGDSARDLQGRLQPAGGARATSPRASGGSCTTQFSERPLLEEVVGVGVDLPQQQPYPRMPAPPRTTSRRRRAGGTTGRRGRRAPARDVPVAPARRAAPCSGAATGCTDRSRSTAAASIRARAARS